MTTPGDSTPNIQVLVDGMNDLQDHVRRETDRIWDHMSLLQNMISQVDLELSDFIEEVYSKPDPDQR